MKRQIFFKGYYNNEYCKNTCPHFQIFFSEKTGPVSTQLGTKQSLAQMKACAFSQGEIIMKQRKKIDEIQTIFFSKIFGQSNQTKYKVFFRYRGIKFVERATPIFFESGDAIRNRENTLTKLKPPEPPGQCYPNLVQSNLV